MWTNFEPTVLLSSRSQFHQHFTCAFFVQKFVQSQTLSREKLLNLLSYEKCVHKPLMKLTPCLNFIYILHEAFTSADPKSIQNIVKPLVSFLRFWVVRIKAVHKMLLKSTQVSISYTFYMKLLCMQISKGNKFSLAISIFLGFWNLGM